MSRDPRRLLMLMLLSWATCAHRGAGEAAAQAPGSDGAWVRVALSANPIPHERGFHSLAYDPAHDRFIAFGGYDEQFAYNDVWSVGLDAPHAAAPAAARPPAACLLASPASQ